MCWVVLMPVSFFENSVRKLETAIISFIHMQKLGKSSTLKFSKNNVSKIKLVSSYFNLFSLSFLYFSWTCKDFTILKEKIIE